MENGDIASMISKIVQNPEFVGMVNDLRGDGKSTAETQKEMLDKLPDVMSMVSPMLGDTRSGDRSEDKPTAAPVPPSKSGKYDKARATKLMQALKPYLSHERAEIIDKCVSVMQITDIVGAVGGLDGLIKTK